jgi:superoxide dismutase, Fe-Mn family
MPEYQIKPLPISKELTGISRKTLEIHHDKLYAGYVAKMNEVNAKLVALRDNSEALSAANQSYSELRALRSGETFSTNGVYLHEHYFGVLGGPSPALGTRLGDAIAAKWGSIEKFIEVFSASGMAMRGWVVLALDTHAKELKIYGCDSHDQGGVWGSIPLIVLDVYEHAYFIDYGSDRKKYIADFWKNMDWKEADAAFTLYSNLIMK